MTFVETRWVLTDDLEIHPTTITGKRIAQAKKDENEILHDVLGDILDRFNWKWCSSPKGVTIHNREYLNNELHKQ